MSIWNLFIKKKHRYNAIKAQIVEEINKPKYSSDWVTKQKLNLTLLWIEMKKNEKEIIKKMNLRHYFKKVINELPETREVESKDIRYPQKLDANILIHYKFSEKIIKGYAGIIANSKDYGYDRCMYKPASILPYPKEYIEKAFKFTYECAKKDNPLVKPPIDVDKQIKNLRIIEVLLPYFLNLSEKELPKEPKENIKVAELYK